MKTVSRQSRIQPCIPWVDLIEARRTIVLPDPWPELEGAGFHSDLLGRAYAHAAYCGQQEMGHNAAIVLSEVGQGFRQPFNPSAFCPQDTDPQGNLKNRALTAITELSRYYGDRVSSVVWNALAHLASREDPEQEASIIKEAATGRLPHHYMLVDSALHAVGLVYTFALHVNSVMFRHTGRILVHNCDCNCSLVNLEEVGGRIEYDLPLPKVVAASQSVLTHLLAETVKLIECGLPFAYSITPEARQIQAIL